MVPELKFYGSWSSINSPQGTRKPRNGKPPVREVLIPNGTERNNDTHGRGTNVFCLFVQCVAVAELARHLTGPKIKDRHQRAESTKGVQRKKLLNIKRDLI